MQLTRRIAIGVLAIGVSACCRADAASVADFVNFTLPNPGVGNPLLPGRLYVPPEAASSPRPLIVFLHGAGESGLNNTAQVNGNIDNLLAEAKRRGAFLYAPQTLNNWGAALTTDRVMTMVDKALADYSVDPSRLYVTGLSNGGGGTWNMLSRYSDRFAAGVPICGVAPAVDFLTANLLDQAIWAFHARNDGTVSVTQTRSRYNAILGAVGEPTPTYLSTRDLVDSQFASAALDVRYTEYYTGGHGIWGRVYNTPAMYDWLFAHSLVPEPGTAALASGLMVCALAFKRRRKKPRINADQRRCG